MHILIILNLAQRKLYSHFYFLKKKIIEFFNDGNESVDICLLNKNIFALSLFKNQPPLIIIIIYSFIQKLLFIYKSTTPHIPNDWYIHTRVYACCQVHLTQCKIGVSSP